MLREDLLARARDESQLSLREGIVPLLNGFAGAVNIISIGWSMSFIAEAIRSRGVDVDKLDSICANDLVFDNHGVASGEFTKPRMMTARHKQKRMEVLLSERKSRSQDGSEHVLVVVSTNCIRLGTYPN